MPQMTIRLLAFATASDAVGATEIDIAVEPLEDVRALKKHLEGRFPDLAPLWGRVAIAIDGEVVGDDALVPDGAEVALLPPVSGGAGARVALVHEPIEVERVIRSVARGEDGAVVLFLGAVRNHHGGRPVERILYSAYERMALRRLERIALELEAEGVSVAIVHRLGTLEVGEASVAIATASPHRAEAYEGNRKALERLKAEVPIWKREAYADGKVAWREAESLLPSQQLGG